jgi:hypothetical protein
MRAELHSLSRTSQSTHSADTTGAILVLLLYLYFIQGTRLAKPVTYIWSCPHCIYYRNDFEKQQNNSVTCLLQEKHNISPMSYVIKKHYINKNTRIYYTNLIIYSTRNNFTVITTRETPGFSRLSNTLISQASPKKTVRTNRMQISHDLYWHIYILVQGEHLELRPICNEGNAECPA